MKTLPVYRITLACIAVGFLLTAGVLAQFPSRSSRGRMPERSEYPQWTIDPDFKHDTFTFVRVQYGHGRRSRGGWSNDFPDCDWNFSYRLQQLTSMNVDPNGRVLRLTDPELMDYPFIYMSNVQTMHLAMDEATSLRQYLKSGGFLMADDFWTPSAWRHVKREMARVFPELQPQELSLDHKIFHLVYDFKKMPRVPSMLAWQQGHMFEYWHGDPEGDEDPHFQGYFDDDGRLMALFCHNNDIGDGWEREGDNREFFEKFSVKISYPLGINIVMYAMTH